MFNKFVVVPPKSKVAQSADLKTDDKEQNLTLYRGLGRANAKGRMPNWRGKLAFMLTPVNSAAATGIGWAAAVIPSSSAEYVSLASLYGEMTAHGFDYFFGIQLSLASTSSPTSAVGYEPLTSITPTSVAQILPYDHHFGPVKSTGSATNDSHPTPVTKSGYWTFSCHPKPRKQPPVVPVSSVATDVMGFGVYTDTNNLAIFGYVVGYTEAAAVGITSTFGYMVVDCEFRSRT